MTRTFNEKIRCQQCGCESTVETDFERWMRGHPSLDSKHAGIVRFDLDVLLHNYKRLNDLKGSRDVQQMMFIEVKTFNAEPSPSQVDTLSMLNQVMRNRVVNKHGRPRRQMGGQPRKVWSKMMRKAVTLYMYGGHLLQLANTTPANSATIMWDKRPINSDTLMELLTFDRDPDDPKKVLDIRRRDKPYGIMRQLPIFPD